MKISIWALSCLFLSADPILAAEPQDITLFLVEKSRWFRQITTDTTIPAPKSPGVAGDTVNGPFEVFSMVTIASGGALSSAQVLAPNSTRLMLVSRPTRSAFLAGRSFSSQAEMDVTFPNGTYNFTIETVHQGTFQPILNLTGDIYPAIPRFTNFEEAQSISALQSFVFNWTSFSGSTPDDALSFRIFSDTGALILETPVLAATTTSTAIPSGTLLSGRRYTAMILFFKVASLNFTIPGAIGIAEYNSVTTMEFSTGPIIHSISFPQNQSMTLQVRGIDGKQYEVQTTSTVPSLNWNPVKTVQAPAALFSVQVDVSAAPAFFRLKEK
jgi:hypothetical protein